ncbi:MAG: hypothetical protein HPY67_12380 [Syntrophaceae bacterium]|nr:hypothetical protein [Syntrophaceae bacterium]
MKKTPGERLILALVLAVLAGALYALAPPGLASNEEGVQYVQIQNFALNGSREIAWPGFRLGFEARDLAGQGGFYEARGGEVYATPPPLFPWLASLFYPVFGERAGDFAAILFVFLSALVLGLILDRLMKRESLYWLLLAGFLFGSPVLLQAFQLSGMSLSLLLIVSALWILMDHFGGNPSWVKLFLASVLVGASALVRIECLAVVFSFYLCTAVVLFAQKRQGDLWTVFAGGVLCLVALVLHDVLLHGRFPGPYLELVLPFYALSPVRTAALAGAAGAACALFVLSRREGIRPVLRAVMSVLSVLAVLGAVVVTAARISVAPLMALFPAVLFVFFGLPGRLGRLKRGEAALEGIVTGTVVLCLAIGAAVLHPGPWIVMTVWLPIVPLVIVLIALERETLLSAVGMRLVFAFFCGVALVNGIQESRNGIFKYKEYNAGRISFLERHTSPGDVIVFGDPGSLEHAGPLFFGRAMVVAAHPRDLDRFAGTAAGRAGSAAFAWTANPRWVRGYNPYAEEALPAFPFPPGAKSCCRGTCKERNYYLVRLDTRAAVFAGSGQGG